MTNTRGRLIFFSKSKFLAEIWNILILGFKKNYNAAYLCYGLIDTGFSLVDFVTFWDHGNHAAVRCRFGA